MNSKILFFAMIIATLTSCTKEEEDPCATEGSATMIIIKYPDNVGIVTECFIDNTSNGGYTVGAIERHGNTYTIHSSGTLPSLPDSSQGFYVNPEICYHSLGFTLVDSANKRQTVVKIPLGSSANSCAYQIMDQIIQGLN